MMSFIFLTAFIFSFSGSFFTCSSDMKVLSNVSNEPAAASSPTQHLDKASKRVESCPSEGRSCSIPISKLGTPRHPHCFPKG